MFLRAAAAPAEDGASAMSAIRVLLADDHETVRQGLKLLIDAQSDMEVVADVSDGRRAVERARAGADARCRGPRRLDAADERPGDDARDGRARRRALAIVALTRYSDEAYVQALLAAGAMGYVLKQSDPSELLLAIRAAAAGKQYLDSALRARRRRVRGPPRAPGSASAPRITEREAEVLRLMALGHSNKEIAAQLDISVKTVEVHKANAMRKLGLRGRIDIVRYAVLQGWLQDP